MFCKYCGNSIQSNAGPCPTCGREQGPLENESRFRELFKFDGASGGSTAEQGKIEENRPVNPIDQKQSRKSRLLLSIVLPILGLFMLISAIGMGISASGTKQSLKKIGDVERGQSRLSSDVGQMKENMEDVNEELAEMKEELTGLQGEVRQLTGAEEEPESELDFDGAKLLFMPSQVTMERLSASTAEWNEQSIPVLAKLRDSKVKILGIRWQKRSDPDGEWEDVPEECLLLKDPENGFSIIDTNGDTAQYRVIYYVENKVTADGFLGLYTDILPDSSPADNPPADNPPT